MLAGTLEKSLLELRKIKSNKGLLKVIFGCGGNRDSSKRPLMGEVAAKIADEIISLMVIRETKSKN